MLLSQKLSLCCNIALSNIACQNCSSDEGLIQLIQTDFCRSNPAFILRKMEFYKNQELHNKNNFRSKQTSWIIFIIKIPAQKTWFKRWWITYRLCVLAKKIFHISIQLIPLQSFVSVMQHLLSNLAIFSIKLERFFVWIWFQQRRIGSAECC